MEKPSTLHSPTLTDLDVGQSGVICGIAGERSQRMKLLDAGLTPGTAVEVTKIAPMGNPIQVAVRSYLLTLRKEEAALIGIRAASAGKSGTRKPDTEGGGAL